MSSLDSTQRYKLKRFVRELKGIRGLHTELVTVYIPAGYELIKIIQHLQQEQGTASNIKDKTNRQNVVDSLERMIRHLRLFKATPPNGLAVFSGNIASLKGKQDIRVWSIEPPVPLNIRMYRCDKIFITPPLDDMMAFNDTFGLIVMDNREATIAFLKGKSIQIMKDMHSNVPGKLKVGGFSQQRYARLREDAANEFYKRIAEVANHEFLAMGADLKGILIGGPGMTKEIFLNGSYLNNELKKKVIATRDLGYTGEHGLHELIERSHDALAEEEITKEKQIVQEFLTLLATNSDKVVYGVADVKKALEHGAVDKLLLSEDFQGVDELEDMAEATKTKIFIISTETKEGVQLRDLGGAAAILRYPIKGFE